MTKIDPFRNQNRQANPAKCENNLQRFLASKQYQDKVRQVWLAMLRSVYTELDRYDPFKVPLKQSLYQELIQNCVKAHGPFADKFPQRLNLPFVHFEQFQLDWLKLFNSTLLQTLPTTKYLVICTVVHEALCFTNHLSQLVTRDQVVSPFTPEFLPLILRAKKN